MKYIYILFFLLSIVIYGQDKEVIITAKFPFKEIFKKSKLDFEKNFKIDSLFYDINTSTINNDSIYYKEIGKKRINIPQQKNELVSCDYDVIISSSAKQAKDYEWKPGNNSVLENDFVFINSFPITGKHIVNRTKYFFDHYDYFLKKHKKYNIVIEPDSLSYIFYFKRTENNKYYEGKIVIQKKNYRLIHFEINRKNIQDFFIIINPKNSRTIKYTENDSNEIYNFISTTDGACILNSYQNNIVFESSLKSKDKSKDKSKILKSYHTNSSIIKMDTIPSCTLIQKN